MHRLTGMARILIAFLVLRVVAAPIAVRPDAPKHSTSDRFVVRVCSWPVQRPVRMTTVAILIERRPCAVGGSASDLIPSSRHRARGAFAAQALLSRSRFWSSKSTSPVHLTDCPRC